MSANIFLTRKMRAAGSCATQEDSIRYFVISFRIRNFERRCYKSNSASTPSRICGRSTLPAAFSTAAPAVSLDPKPR